MDNYTLAHLRGLPKAGSRESDDRPNSNLSMYIIKLDCGEVKDGHYNVAWNKQSIADREYCLECCKHSQVVETYWHDMSKDIPA